MPRSPAAAASTAASRDPADRVVRFFRQRLRHVKDRWAGHPFILEPWQENEIIRPLYGTLDRHGLRRYNEALIGIARKNGKALDVHTPILSRDGWTTMGELRPGDYVHAADGSLARVLAVSPIDERSAFEVRFADGATLMACAEHRWTVNDRLKRRERVIDTAELADTLHVGARGDRRYTVTVPQPLRRPAAALPLDPYLLGVWLGDGSTAQPAITSADPEILAAFSAAGFVAGSRQRRGAAASVYFKGLRPHLTTLGILGAKRIPEAYLLGDSAQRLALLQGLMDTDGGVIRGPNTPRVEFCSTNANLAAGVAFLARSLGWKATLRESDAVLRGRVVGRRWRVAWTAHRDAPPFRLERKATALHPPPDRPTRAATNAIIAVLPAGVRRVRCIVIDHPSHTFLAGRHLTPTHNSELAAGLGLYGLFADGHYDADGVWHPLMGAEVYVVAGSREQAHIIFNTAKAMVRADPILSALASDGRAHGSKVYKDAIAVPETDSVFRVLAADARLAHGYNPSTAILDELHVHRDDELYEAFKTGTAARQQPLVLAITTAGSEQARSIAHRLYRAGKRRGNRGRFYFRWWEAPEGCRVDDSKAMRAANPASWVTIKFLRDQLASPGMTEFMFRRLHLNQWWDQQTQVLPLARWDEGRAKPTFPEGCEVVLGVDVAPRGDDRTAVVLTRRDEQRRIHARLVLFHPDEGLGMIDYLAVEDLIRSYAKAYRVREVAYDPTAFDRSARILDAEGLPMTEFGQTDSRMIPASQGLYQAVMEGRIVHGGDAALREHAENAGARETNRGWRFDKRKSRGRIDGIVALAMAVHRWDHLDEAPEVGFVFLDADDRLTSADPEDPGGAVRLGSDNDE